MTLHSWHFRHYTPLITFNSLHPPHFFSKFSTLVCDHNHHQVTTSKQSERCYCHQKKENLQRIKMWRTKNCLLWKLCPKTTMEKLNWITIQAHDQRSRSQLSIKVDNRKKYKSGIKNLNNLTQIIQQTRKSRKWIPCKKTNMWVKTTNLWTCQLTQISGTLTTWKEGPFGSKM